MFYTNYCLSYSVVFSKELGQDDAKNQTIQVKCTTDTGLISEEVCTIRRYVVCNNKNCEKWGGWKIVHNPLNDFQNWQEAAINCCKAKGLK